MCEELRKDGQETWYRIPTLKWDVAVPSEVASVVYVSRSPGRDPQYTQMDFLSMRGPLCWICAGKSAFDPT